MDRKHMYLIGAGVVAGGVILYLHKSKKSTAPAGEEAGHPLYAQGAIGEGGEERGRFEAAEAKSEIELGFEKELVSQLESRPSASQEVFGAKELLEGLGIPVGYVAGPQNQQATSSSTNSSNSESGSHLPTPPPPPAIVKSVAQALEAVPNSAHSWQLSTTGPTAGHYYYQGTFEGKPVHIYHWTGLPSFVGPHHNLVVV